MLFDPRDHSNLIRFHIGKYSNMRLVRVHISITNGYYCHAISTIFPKLVTNSHDYISASAIVIEPAIAVRSDP